MKFPISKFQFPMFKFKKSFVRILFLFFSIVIGLFFLGVIQIQAAPGDPCTTNFNCNEGAEEVCSRTELQEIMGEPGECIAGPSDGTCTRDEDCGTEAICQDGRCMSGSRDDIGDGDEGDDCSGDSGCQSGLRCVDDICTNVMRRDTSSVVFNNPLSANTIPELISTILSAVIGLIGVLAVAAFVYGGILYMTSGGSEEQSGKAKKVLIYAVMGLIVSILSYVIVNTVISVISG